jgi:hypothetical protein
MKKAVILSENEHWFLVDLALDGKPAFSRRFATL